MSIYSLSNIQLALSLIGNPHLQYKVIHIAGSNGKGSTAKFIYHILLKANFNVGIFTSPYIDDITETIVCNGVQVSKYKLLRIYLNLRPLLLANAIVLSEFE